MPDCKASGVNVLAKLINETTSGVLSVNPQGADIPFFLIWVVWWTNDVSEVESTYRT
jgi:hypothetical protein